MTMKPCPFCGECPEIAVCDDEGNIKGEGYEQDPWGGLGYRIVHVSEDCPVATDEEGGRNIYDTREEAEEHWNRRSSECDKDELLKVADEIECIADNASTDTIGPFLQISTIRPASVKAFADRIRKALGIGR